MRLPRVRTSVTVARTPEPILVGAPHDRAPTRAARRGPAGWGVAEPTRKWTAVLAGVVTGSGDLVGSQVVTDGFRARETPTRVGTPRGTGVAAALSAWRSAPSSSTHRKRSVPDEVRDSS